MLNLEKSEKYNDLYYNVSIRIVFICVLRHSKSTMGRRDSYKCVLFLLGRKT